ncbi:response regulator transcription factor [Paenibacillus sp. CMAA1364]
MFRVLLIDDEPNGLEGMKLLIDWNELGFEICGTCSNGVEGLQMIEQLAPDLVLTDVRMPLMNGLEMIEAAQGLSSIAVRFAIVSAYSEFEYAQKAMRYGVHHYLLKPIMADEATEELRDIYKQLKKEAEIKDFHQKASYEENVTLITEMLNGVAADKRNSSVLTELSSSKEEWNFILLETEQRLKAGLRESAVKLMAAHEAVFMIDLEPNRFGFVYGCSPDENQNESFHLLFSELLHHCGARAFMSLGASEQSLFRIGNCYQTAKEAMMYTFYYEDYTSFIIYHDIKDIHFSYHYHQIGYTDAIVQAIELVNKVSLRSAIDSAVASFREMLVAPEIIRKIIIHIVYVVMESIRATNEAQIELLYTKFKWAEISNLSFTLSDIMDNLRSFGEESIDILLDNQRGNSQGVIKEINDYIIEHYRENLSIKKLADIFYLHPVYLGQLLMKKNGINFNELLHNLRIEEAMGLLRQNQFKNNQIAELVGYSNYDKFSKQFSKRMNMSPNEYKSRMS